MSLTVAALLAEWGVLASGIAICDAATLLVELETFAFADASAWFRIEGAFASGCRVLIPKGTPPAAAKTVIRKLSPAVQTDVTVAVIKPAPSLAIGIGGQSARLFIGRFGYAFNAQINTWRDPTVCIGDRCTCNGASIIADDAEIVLGRDCMLSDQIVLQSHAQHGVIDLASMRIVNTRRHHLSVGEHVWIGRRATLMPNVSVGSGSIVATGAVVTHDVPGMSLAAGVPATVKRSNVSWTRTPDRIDGDATAFLELSDPRAPDGTREP